MESGDATIAGNRKESNSNLDKSLIVSILVASWFTNKER